jgi:hypothetical protein
MAAASEGSMVADSEEADSEEAVSTAAGSEAGALVAAVFTAAVSEAVALVAAWAAELVPVCAVVALVDRNLVAAVRVVDSAAAASEVVWEGA